MKSPLTWLSLLWATGLSLCLIWAVSMSQAALHHHSGKCRHKEKLFKPGQTFSRGCDKCYCHEKGFTCFQPMIPTSWPNKCQRIRAECGYRVVYRKNPETECRPYSWIG